MDVYRGSEVKFSRLETVWNTRTHTTVISGLTRSERLACIFSKWSGLVRTPGLHRLEVEWGGKKAQPVSSNPAIDEVDGVFAARMWSHDSSVNYSVNSIKQLAFCESFVRILGRWME